MPRKVRKDLIDLTGQKFGAWTVLRRAPDKVYPSQRVTMWWCRCACGVEQAVYGFHMRSGKTTRCDNCRYKSVLKYKEGERIGTRTLLYYTPDNRAEGGRHGHWAWRCDCGATGVCTTPAVFRYRRCRACIPGGEYGNIVPIEINGVSRSASAWAKLHGLTRQTVWHRLTMGWPPERAVSEPVLAQYSHKKAANR